MPPYSLPKGVLQRRAALLRRSCAAALLAITLSLALGCAAVKVFSSIFSWATLAACAVTVEAAFYVIFQIIKLKLGQQPEVCRSLRNPKLHYALQSRFQGFLYCVHVLSFSSMCSRCTCSTQLRSRSSPASKAAHLHCRPLYTATGDILCCFSNFCYCWNLVVQFHGPTAMQDL